MFFKLVTKFPSMSILFDNQSNVGHNFLPHVEHPEHCCPEGIIIWENQLLTRHYDSSLNTNIINTSM
ncbi:LOW QUALITY PROTEIN: hypothetical protein HZS_6980 [Henneguya salminicola]|nr:LOW QUALITY PROTEIN: hypothetical protein HZS_6980 [Henneguya salminicola]